MITPQEVVDYTKFESVKKRDPRRLAFDIIQAKNEIYQFVGHRFETSKYPTLPDEVELACIKLAEFFALSNMDESFVKGYQSEKIGDYSYSMEDGSSYRKSILTSLLADHVIVVNHRGTTRLKMRSI